MDGNRPVHDPIRGRGAGAVVLVDDRHGRTH